MRKIKIHSETVYVLALLTLSFAVCMSAAADFGISMIVAPAYIMSQKFTIFTFGQWDYILQGVLFIAFCICMKRAKPLYLVSFLTCVIYGTLIDMWRIIIPHFNPEITAPGSMDTPIRILYFVLGMIMTGVAVAMFFRTYIYPEVCDLFVVGITKKYGLDRRKFKWCFDASCLLVSCVLTFLFFGRLVGIGVGTFIITAVNSAIISFFGKLYDRYFEITPLSPQLAKRFEG